MDEPSIFEAAGFKVPKAAPKDSAPSGSSIFEAAGFKLPTKTAAEPSEDAPAAAKKNYDISKEAERLAKVSSGVSGSVVEGMPIIGPLAQKGAAAAQAAIDPMLGRGGDAAFGERYAANLEIAKQAREIQSGEHPALSTAGNIAGAVAGTAPFAANALTGRMLGTVGNTVGARFYGGALGGAAIGAADNLLRGDDAASGAVLGGAGGAAGPLIGKGVGNIVAAAKNALRAPPPALAGINPIGREWLAHALTNETPSSLTAARERMGPRGFAADINPAMTDLATGVAGSAEAPASSQITEAYRMRQAAQRADIDAALTRNAGPKTNIEDFKDFITENRKAAADPLYEQFRATKVHPTDELKALVPRLEKVGAFDEAEILGSAKGVDINRKFFTGGPQKEWPTAETWDLVKRGLDSKIEQAYSGGNKTRAAALIGLKNEMVGEIEKTPGGQIWKQARSEFADRSALLDQIEAGKDTFLGGRHGASADELRNELKGLSGPELRARLVGLRGAADDVMGSTMNGDTTLRNKFLAPNNQEKLRLMLGDQRATDLIRSMEQNKYLADQNQFVNPRAGSATQGRTAARNALQAPTLEHWNLKPLEPFSWVPPSWLDALRPSTILQGGRDASYAGARQQIARALLTREPGINALLTAIGQESASRGHAADQGELARRLATLAVAGPGAEATRRKMGTVRNALIGAAH